MKRFSLIILALMFISYTGCKSKSDVLATFNDDQITRGEFYEWMEVRMMPKENILKKKSQQKNKLQMLALEEIIEKEAKKAGYDKSEDFKYIMTLAQRNFAAGYFSTNFRKNFSFTEKAAHVKIIKLLVKNYKIANNRRVTIAGAELETAFQEKMKKALGIIAALNNGGTFEELAKKNSDDFSKNKGGDIGYITGGMRGTEFSKAVFSVKEGEYTKEPVRIANALYIIKVEDLTELTKDNIDDVIKNKRQASALKKRILMSSMRDHQMKLMKATDIENKIKKAPLANPETLLFKVGKTEFKVSDLNSVIKYVYKKRQGMGFSPMNFTDKMKRDMAARIFREEVLAREVRKSGNDKNAEFKKQLKYFMKYNLARSYEGDMILTGIKVTAADIQNEYNKNRDKMYSRFENRGGKRVRKALPFTKVKSSIEYRLLNQKRALQRKSWKKQLLGKSKFAVMESELEGE